MIAFGLSKKVGDSKKRSILTVHVFRCILNTGGGKYEESQYYSTR